MKTQIAVLVAVLLAVALTVVWTQTGQRQVSLVITNGTVVTMNMGGRVIANGAGAIDGSDIVAVDAADTLDEPAVLSEARSWADKVLAAVH